MLLAWAQAKTPLICGILLKRNGGQVAISTYIFTPVHFCRK
jgi:hypothetical protein